MSIIVSRFVPKMQNFLSPALPLVTIAGGDTITVEIGGPVEMICVGSSVHNDVTVSWIRTVDGEEIPGAKWLTARIGHQYLYFVCCVVSSIGDLSDSTLEELRLLYIIQPSPDNAVLTNTSLALTSSAIEGVYTCRGTNEFGEDSSDISILVQGMFNTHTILPARQAVILPTFL